MKIYLNLTNGLEILNYDVSLAGLGFRFIRIQSTACEQKDFYRIIENLSDDFLFNLAIGNHVLVADATKTGRPSRAIWQGLTWVVYCLYRVWFHTEKMPGWDEKKERQMVRYFRDLYRDLPKRTYNRLKYYRRWLHIEDLSHLNWLSISTQHDGDYQYFKDLVFNSRLIERKENVL